MRIKVKHIILLTFLPLWLATVPLKAQQVKAFSKIDTTAIMIGDQIAFDFGIQLPDTFNVQWPQFADTLTGGIEIIKKLPPDTVTTDLGKQYSQRFVITGFDSGYYQLPSVRFVFTHGNDTTRYTIDTDPIGLKIFVPDVDTTKAFKPIAAPIEEPVTIGEVLPWVGLALLIIALVVFGIWYYQRRKQNKPVFGKKEKPLPPPHIVALNKLEELRLAKLWQAGKVKEYHSTITDIMREYLERRYGFNAMEMTTDEIFDELKTRPVNDQAYGKLKNAFELADLVKFAKANPTPLENDQSIYDCIDFVNETKVIRETTQDKPLEKKEKEEKAEDKPEEKRKEESDV